MIFFEHEVIALIIYLLDTLSKKKKLGDSFHDCYRFNTYAFSSLLDLYKLFFNSNKKKVIPNNIEELLTPLALAIWIMDFRRYL